MKLLPLGFVFLLGAALSADAVTISQWTFEVNTPPDQTSAASPNATADVGNGTASGLHASAATDWSTPAGNGSPNSFSANTWAVNDYWQFRLSTVGFEDVSIRWDQTRSSTGPATFHFAYSVDGTAFTTALNSYTVPVVTWSSGGTPDTASSFSLDLSAISILDQAPSVYFRLIADSAPSGTTGSNRVDNFTVSATRVPDSLPFGYVFATFAGVLLVAHRSAPRADSRL